MYWLYGISFKRSRSLSHWMLLSLAASRKQAGARVSLLQSHVTDGSWQETFFCLLLFVFKWIQSEWLFFRNWRFESVLKLTQQTQLCANLFRLEINLGHFPGESSFGFAFAFALGVSLLLFVFAVLLVERSFRLFISLFGPSTCKCWMKFVLRARTTPRTWSKNSPARKPYSDIYGQVESQVCSFRGSFNSKQSCSTQAKTWIRILACTECFISSTAQSINAIFMLTSVSLTRRPSNRLLVTDEIFCQLH